MFRKRNGSAGSEGLPHNTSRDFVDPIYARILARSGGASHPPEMTDDAEIHLVIESGARIPARRVRQDLYIFRVPEGVANADLASRTSRPTEMVGPFLDDRRDLGILVSEIRLFYAAGTQNIEAPFVEADLPCWHGLEASHCRWTGGAGLVPLLAMEEPRVLTVRVLAKGPYLVRSVQHVAA